jgi:hypothetical protein
MTANAVRALASESTGANGAVSMPRLCTNFFSTKRSCRRSRARAFGLTSRNAESNVTASAGMFSNS